jgi:Hypothetical protein (DUF2513)
MKRDMDLVRKILLKIEELPSYDELVDIEIEGYSEENIQFHLIQLQEANLIEVLDIGLSKFQGRVNIAPTRLTWQGHEFLDNARDETRWNEAKKIAGQKGGSMAFDVIKGVLVQLALKMVSP